MCAELAYSTNKLKLFWKMLPGEPLALAELEAESKKSRTYFQSMQRLQESPKLNNATFGQYANLKGFVVCLYDQCSCKICKNPPGLDKCASCLGQDIERLCKCYKVQI